jgi:hypothetical protein
MRPQSKVLNSTRLWSRSQITDAPSRHRGCPIIIQHVVREFQWKRRKICRCPWWWPNRGQTGRLTVGKITLTITMKEFHININ